MFYSKIGVHINLEVCRLRSIFYLDLIAELINQEVT